MTAPSPRRVLGLVLSAACALTSLAAAAPPAQAAADHVVINEFYGRGGSAGQPYLNKFVELFNPTSAAIDLGGTSLQYRSAIGTGVASGTVALTGTIAARGYFLIQLNSNGTSGGALPIPDASSSLAPSGTNGTVFLATGTAAINPDIAASQVIDKVGYGTSNSPETSPAAYPGTNTTVGSLNRAGGADTDNNSVDFTFRAEVTPQNSGAPVEPPPPVTAAIGGIQGTGGSTPLSGQRVRTQGVVTAAYPVGGFRGVYLQTPGTGGTAKQPGDASDGIFVFSDAAAAGLSVGDCVDIEGTAGEFNGLTQLSSVTYTAATDCAPVVETPLASFPSTGAAKEAYEGMLVLPQGTYTITNNFALNQFGQLGLAVGDQPLYVATEKVAPGPDAVAYEAANQAKLITLDDGSSWNYMTNTTAQRSALPYLSAAEPMRTGSQLTFTKPVILDFRFQWNYQPTGQIVGATDADDPVTSENDREATVPDVGGNVQLASFNVLNYFTDLGMDEPGCRYFADMYGTPVATNLCEVRGAWTEAAFADQKAKILAAISGTKAEVVALMEIENSAGISYIDHERDYTLASLVRDLNAAAGRTRWAYAQSPVVTPGTEDVIRTAFIYDPNVVQALGASIIDLDDAFANARYPLAQKFKARSTGKPFTAIANHFKSKGSGPDDGTGQGLSNPSREAQARQVTAWAAEMFGTEATFLMGDFNAYSKETPVQLIESAGYVNVVKRYEPQSSSYQFQGRLGSLDHIFANAEGLRLVTGAAIWDINGDEAVAFQYSRRNYNIVDFYAPDPFASSDHDPAVAGLDTEKMRP